VVRTGQGSPRPALRRIGAGDDGRPTAILELTWDRVDFERGTVDLNPSGRRQTRKRRPVVPLNDDALEALREAYKGRQSQFVIERGAQQVKSIKKAFQAASARSGIHVTPYTLRHTGAVWAAEAGGEHGRARAVHGPRRQRDDRAALRRFSPGHLRRVATRFSGCGSVPTHWMPLPELPRAAK
jgi:integrase